MGLPALSTVCMYMCCEALALFRAKNRKQQSEENQDKTKRIEQTRHSDRVGTSNAFQTSSERVHDVRMSPSQSGTELCKRCAVHFVSLWRTEQHQLPCQDKLSELHAATHHQTNSEPVEKTTTTTTTTTIEKVTGFNMSEHMIH